MSATHPSDKDHPADLAESDKDAASPPSGNRREDGSDERIGEVPPIDGDSIPIQGIDPATGR